MADAKPKATSFMVRRGPRSLRLAVPCLAALAIMLSARGDSFSPQVDVGSRAFLDAGAASHGYCNALYGIGPGRALPQCPPRVASCMDFQRAARERLDAEWEGLAPGLRRGCVQEARQSFSRDQEDEAVRTRVSDNGYAQGFSHDAVERCVARRLHRAAPAPWSAWPVPASCQSSGTNPPPPEAAWSPGDICRRIVGNAGNTLVDACVVRESAAQARLAPRWPSLTPAVVQLCSAEIRARAQFQGGPDSWSYTDFEGCLTRIRP